MGYILITGVGGNVGQYLAQALHMYRYSVIGIYRNTEPYSHEYKLVHTDLCKDKLEFEDIDTIIHVAAGLDGSTEKLVRDNIDATMNLVKFAEEKKVERFIYMSSVSVYGEANGELDIDSDIINPTMYGMTKYVSESLVKEANIPFKVIIGLPRMLGPFVDLEDTQGSGFLTMTKKILNDEDVICFIPDQIYNNYMHVSDLACFLEVILENKPENGYVKVLLGAKDRLSMLEILQTMKEAAYSQSNIYIRETKNIVPCALVNIDSAVKLGYTPTDSKEIIHKFISELSGNNKKGTFR